MSPWVLFKYVISGRIQNNILSCNWREKWDWGTVGRVDRELKSIVLWQHKIEQYKVFFVLFYNLFWTLAGFNLVCSHAKKGKGWNTPQWGTEFSRSPLHSVKSRRSAWALQLAFRASESRRTACTTMHFKWASALHPHSFLHLVDLVMLVQFVGLFAWRRSPNSLVSSVPLERSSVMWFISIEERKRTKWLHFAT